MANKDIQLIVGADVQKSYEQLAQDVQGLINRISNAEKYKIKLGAKLVGKKPIQDLAREAAQIIENTNRTAKIKIDIDQGYIENQYKKVVGRITKGDFAKVGNLSLIDDATLSKLKADALKAQQIIKDFQNSTLSSDSMKDVGKFSTKDIDNLEKKLQSVSSKLKKNDFKGLKDEENIKRVTASYDDLQNKIEAVKSAEAAEKATKIPELEKEITKHNELVQTYKEQEAAAAKAAAESKKEVAAEVTNINAAKAARRDQLSLIKQIQDYLRANSRIENTQYGTRLNGMLTNLNSENFDKAKLNEYVTSFRQVKSEVNAAGLAGKSFSDTIVSGIKKFSSWFGISRIVMDGVRGVKEMISMVTQLDTAMTELRKVTDLTETQYKQFGNTAANLAKDVGATVVDTINSTADFARLGYSLSDSTELAKSALVYKNVGDGIEDISDASESIISTIKAFNIEAKKSMNIVDEYNEVGNRFAISSEGIGTALKKSAASLAVAGNSLEESIGLATGMNSVIQNPDQVGTALKTMTMYLRAAKVEAKDAGEDTEGMANSVSELQKKIKILTDGKVDIMLDSKNFKSTYQIIKEISQVWSDISDVDQAALLKLIAGKRNANTVTSLIENFKDAEAAMQTASNATGSATKENEKFMSSIEGRKAKLKASTEAFSDNFFETDSVKDFVSLLDKIVNMADDLVSTIGTIPTLVGTISAALSFGNVGELINQFHC